jgi:hypothetical protein
LCYIVTGFTERWKLWLVHGISPDVLIVARLAESVQNESPRCWSEG